jgi:outer membrane biogenesis lipoprotein LolB
MKTLLVLIAILLLPACASVAGQKCVSWEPKESHYEMKIGAVDRVDRWRCVEFSEAP